MDALHHRAPSSVVLGKVTLPPRPSGLDEFVVVSGEVELSRPSLGVRAAGSERTRPAPCSEDAQYRLGVMETM